MVTIGIIVIQLKCSNTVLERLADKLDSKAAYGTDAKNRASRCRMIAKLMKLVNEDYYALKHHDILESMYGKCEMVTKRLR